MHVCSFSVLSSCSIVIAVLFLTHLTLFVWFLGVSVLSRCQCPSIPFLAFINVILFFTVMVIFNLSVSWVLAAIWRPFPRGMILLPTQNLRIICSLYKPPFWPAFLKSQELHVDAKNLTSTIQIFAWRSMLHSHLWKKLAEDEISY